MVVVETSPYINHCNKFLEVLSCKALYSAIIVFIYKVGAEAYDD